MEDENHEFLTPDEMNEFNEKVDDIVEGKTPDTNQVTRQSQIENPKELGNDVIYLLADIIDGKTHYGEQKDIPEENDKKPNTHDIILNSMAVAYITENNIPIAVALIQDPTVENYKGIIPGDYYEIKSGVKLENKLQQEYFAFKPDKYSQYLGDVLKGIVTDEAGEVFIVISEADEGTKKALGQAGYKGISSVNTEWEENNMEIWIS